MPSSLGRLHKQGLAAVEVSSLVSCLARVEAWLLHSRVTHCPGHLLSGPPARRHPVGPGMQGHHADPAFAGCACSILSASSWARCLLKSVEVWPPSQQLKGDPLGPAGHHAAALGMLNTMMQRLNKCSQSHPCQSQDPNPGGPIQPHKVKSIGHGL